jgi:hypothetical protein
MVCGEVGEMVDSACKQWRGEKRERYERRKGPCLGEGMQEHRGMVREKRDRMGRDRIQRRTGVELRKSLDSFFLFILTL